MASVEASAASVSVAAGSGHDDDLLANPRVFLRFDEPVVDTADCPAALSPVFERQQHILSDVPVVTTTDKVLDCILPPRRYVDASGQRYVQRVDHKQVTREQLSELHRVFLFKLQDAKARTDGICPVRNTVYAMLVDELLRQVAIDSPERGLLLLRIRDELRMTTDAYATLFDNANAYSAKKMFDATRALPEMRSRLAELQADTGSLKKELRRLEAKHAAMQRAVEEQQVADNKKRQEERLFLERTERRLQSHLDAVKNAQDAERKALRADEEPAA